MVPVSSSSSSSYGLDAVNISLLSDAKGKKELPLVISPRWDSSLTFLLEFCRVNRLWLDDMMLRYGAVLIRGFDVENPADMEQAVKAYQPHLNDTYRGTSPRQLMDGTAYIFSAADVPTNYPIAQHIEMSFLDAPPRQLFFGCIQPSLSRGGETALAHFGKVCQDLPSDLKQKFLDKGICYQRTHHKEGTYFTYDVADMLGWPQLFGTSNKSQVEELCAQEGIPVEWQGDTFVSNFQTDAFQLHPVTNQPVWFNHTQVFHWTTFPAELWFAFCRTHEWRLLLHCILVTIFCVVKYGLLGYKMSLHVTFGDGSPISIQEMAKVRQAIHKNMIFTRWQKGDMIWIDNFAVSHGRQPTYDKGRKVVVAWADPFRKTNQVKTLDSVPEETTVCMENPQERTPESTLTQSESQAFQEKLLTKGLEKELQSAFGDNPQEISDETLHTLKNIVAQAEQRKHLSKSHSQPAIVDSFWQMED